MTRSPRNKDSAKAGSEPDKATEASNLPAETELKESLNVPEVTASEVPAIVEEVVHLPGETPDDSGESFPSSEEVQWETLATFTTKFQTRSVDNQIEKRTVVQHHEAGAVEFRSGIEIEFSHQWIANCLAKAMPPIEIGESIPVDSLELSSGNPLRVELIELRALQPSETQSPLVVNQTQRVFPQDLNGNEPYLLEVQFRLTEAIPFDGNQQSISYQIDIYIRDYKSTQPLTISSSGDLTSEDLTYTEVLAGNMLEPGIYNLDAVVAVTHNSHRAWGGLQNIKLYVI